MNHDVLVYLSGPIAAYGAYSVERNIADALPVYRHLLSLGMPAFLPHLNAIYPSCWSGISYETWIAYDFAIIDRCTHVLMLPRWEDSKGATREMYYAGEHGKPIYYSTQEVINALATVTS